jgi:hypothetical protein
LKLLVAGVARQVLLVAGVLVALQTVLMVLQANPLIKEVTEVPEVKTVQVMVMVVTLTEKVVVVQVGMAL